MSPADGPAIRAGTPADALRLTALARRAKAHWGYPVEWLAAWHDDLDITPEYIGQHRVMVAWAEAQPVGVCALEDHGQSWALEHVWVDPSFQRRGIGEALVRQALAVVREQRPGIITVVSDPHAAGFYAQLGARPIGTQPAPMPGAPDRSLPLLEFRVVAE